MVKKCFVAGCEQYFHAGVKGVYLPFGVLKKRGNMSGYESKAQSRITLVEKNPSLSLIKLIFKYFKSSVIIHVAWLHRFKFNKYF